MTSVTLARRLPCWRSRRLCNDSAKIRWLPRSEAARSRQSSLESKIEIATRIDPASVSFVIANTVLTVQRALRFKRPGTPVAAWIHETAYIVRASEYFAAGMRIAASGYRSGASEIPVGRTRALSAPGQRVSVEKSGSSGFVPAARRRIDDRRLWSLGGQEGAGATHAISRSVRPRFAGSSSLGPNGRPRPPYADNSASQHVYTGPIDPDRAKAEIAGSGALVSCAEAEAQPLCAIEALLAGRPVLLSDIDAHRSLASLIPNVFLFDRTSPQSFLEGHAKLRDAMPDIEAAIQGERDNARKLFGESTFDRRLIDILKV